MTLGRLLALALLSVSVAAAGTTFAQDTAANPPKPAGCASCEGLVKSGKFDEALKAADEALSKNAADADASYWKIKALMGLGRYQEAARLAVPAASRFPDRPEFRYEAGACAFEMGFYQQATQMWSALYGNPVWAGAAYARSARALVAQGKSEEAAKLLDDAIAKTAAPPPALLRLYLEVSNDVPKGLAILDRLMQADPSGRADYEALKDLYKAAGSGSLYEEGGQVTYPATIPVKEKTEFRDSSSMTWGGDSTVQASTSSKVVIPISVNGTKEKWMLLDTGTSAVMVSPSYVKELGLQPVAAAQFRGLGEGGTQKSSWVMLKSLKVGPLTVQNVPAMVIGKDAEFFKEVAGIIPISFFKRHAALYDRRHDKLVLNAPGTSPAAIMGKDAFVVRSLWIDGKPFVETTIQDKPGLFCLVDTGAYTTFISAAKIDVLGIRLKSSMGGAMGSGLSGAFHAGVADNVKVMVGKALFNMPTVQVTDIGGGYGVDCYGIIGRNVLDLFQVLFDPSSNVVAFAPYEKG